MATDVQEGVDKTPGSSLGPPLGSRSISYTRAQKIATIYSCVALIGGAISRLKWQIAGDLITQRLMNKRPAQMFSGSSFRRWIMNHILLHGNAVVFIFRNPVTFQPEGFLPLPNGSWFVSPIMKGPLIGRCLYVIPGLRDATGTSLVVDQDDVLHFHAEFFDERTGVGASPLQTGVSGAAALEAAMADYNANFFERGSTAQFAVLKQGKWDSDQRQRFREEFVNRYGGTTGQGVPIVLDNGTDLKQLSINARDSQLIESREFQIADIARAYRVPSFLLNMEQKASSWGSGISQINSSFLHFTLDPHIVHVVDEVDRKLYPEDDTEVKLDTSVLTRGTQLERYRAYREARNWLSVNQVRELEGMDILDDDKYWLPMIELETNIGNEPLDDNVLNKLLFGQPEPLEEEIE